MKNLIRRVKRFGFSVIARTISAVTTIIAYIAAALYLTKMVLIRNIAEGFVDTAVKILISVVIGALVLAGLYLLFSGTILPELTSRIQDMFNYGG